MVYQIPHASAYVHAIKILLFGVVFKIAHQVYDGLRVVIILPLKRQIFMGEVFGQLNFKQTQNSFSPTQNCANTVSFSGKFS